MEVRLPDDLPIVLAGLASVLLSAFLLATIIAEFRLARPSSTAGVGFVIVPFVGLFAGAAAFVAGMTLRWFLRRAGMLSMKVPSWLVWCGILATIACIPILAAIARAQTIGREAALRPRVLLASARFVKSDQASGADSRIEAPRLFSISEDAVVVPSIDWNGRGVRLVGSNRRVTVSDMAGTRIASTDLRAFDYIGSIRAIPVCTHPNGDRDLAVLVTLRATSRRSMLIVYDPTGVVVYQEHLERTGGGKEWAGTMYAGSRGGREVLVVDQGSPSVWTCQPG